MAKITSRRLCGRALDRGDGLVEHPRDDGLLLALVEDCNKLLALDLGRFDLYSLHI